MIACSRCGLELIGEGLSAAAPVSERALAAIVCDVCVEKMLIAQSETESLRVRDLQRKKARDSRRVERTRRLGRLVTFEMLETHPRMAADVVQSEQVRGTHAGMMKELRRWRPAGKKNR